MRRNERVKVAAVEATSASSKKEYIVCNSTGLIFHYAIQLKLQDTNTLYFRSEKYHGRVLSEVRFK